MDKIQIEKDKMVNDKIQQRPKKMTKRQKKNTNCGQTPTRETLRRLKDGHN